MPRKTLYPRSTIKRTIKAHSGRSLSKNVDVLVSHYFLPLQSPPQTTLLVEELTS